MKIDIVYTWVDGADSEWNRKRTATAEKLGAQVSSNANSEARFQHNDELRFSLRSVFQFAPWVNKIFIVTDNQVPSWLDTSHPKITIIDHKSIFRDHSHLPTFSARGIEANLHHIEDLSEHFIYFNDDMFLGKLTKPTHFFTIEGRPYLFAAKMWPKKRAHHLNRSNLIGRMDNEHQHAIENSRILISESLNQDIHHDSRHTVKPMLKSVMYELEEKYADAFLQTSKHPFREKSAIIPYNLFAFYAIAKSLGKVKYLKTIHRRTHRLNLLGRCFFRFNFTYVNMSLEHVQTVLEKVKIHKPSSFCLNQYSDTSAERIEAMKSFMQAYFPDRSDYELN